jgi:hypothetical protein
MIPLPKHFQEELAKATLRHQGRSRHLVLLGNEGLHVLERWRTERKLLSYLKTKRI